MVSFVFILVSLMIYLGGGGGGVKSSFSNTWSMPLRIGSSKVLAVSIKGLNFTFLPLDHLAISVHFLWASSLEKLVWLTNNKD